MFAEFNDFVRRGAANLQFPSEPSFPLCGTPHSIVLPVGGEFPLPVDPLDLEILDRDRGTLLEEFDRHDQPLLPTPIEDRALKTR